MQISICKGYNLRRMLLKGPVQTVTCARLLFRFSDKNQDRLSICSKKQGIYIGKLDALAYCHCWEHLCTLSCKVTKILCLSVLNDDNTVVNKICKYKYSWLSLSRPRLSRITAYLEVKIWSLPKHENLTTCKKYCGKEEKLLLRSNFSSFSQYFQYISNFKSPITHTVKPVLSKHLWESKKLVA